jgi:phosphoglycolate phosphatase-like HAD superfamily hydrolase
LTSSPRAAIFDFDGTIADSLEQVVLAYNEAAASLGLTAVTCDDIARMRSMKPFDAIRAMQVPMWKLPFVVARVRSGMRRRMHLLRPFPGLDAALRRLCDGGCQCYVLSTNTAENIQGFLAHHGMEHFHKVAGGSSLFGKARQIKKLIKRERLDRHEVFYVGDEVRDIAAAREAGVRIISVGWGYSARDALAAEGPDFLVDEPGQLVDVLLGAG